MPTEIRNDGDKPGGEKGTLLLLRLAHNAEADVEDALPRLVAQTAAGTRQVGAFAPRAAADDFSRVGRGSRGTSIPSRWHKSQVAAYSGWWFTRAHKSS